MTDGLFNVQNIIKNMEKEKIIEILDEWNFWSHTPDCGILREGYLQQFEDMVATKQVVVITGVRRSGKSTLMKQHIKRMIDRGEDKRNFLYLNFEEPKFIDELSIEFLIDAFDAYLEIVQPTSTPNIFFDEIQHIEGWERFVRALHEKGSANIFVSGSSAKLLSKELGTALTGRHVDIHVFPLSFREFLEFNDLKLETKLDIVTNKLKIRQMMRNYLSSGGFPLVTLLDGKTDILREYFNDVIIRDIAERHKVTKVDKLRSLAKYYFTNVGALASFRKIANFTGISPNSVERYSDHLNDAYMIFFVKRFSYSLKEQEIKPRKVYAIDQGLRNTVSFKFSEDLGKLYENTVFLKLYREDGEVYYYNSKNECDFLVVSGEEVTQAIQVCYSLTEKNKTREIAGLLEAMDKFNLSEGMIITDDVEGIEEYEGKSIRFVALWKWLLE